MGVIVTDGEKFAQKLMDTKVTCNSCGAVFTFEEGASRAMENGAKGNVVMCPRCGSVFAAAFKTVTPVRPPVVQEKAAPQPAAQEGPLWLRLLLALGVILAVSAVASFVMAIVALFSPVESFGFGQVAFVLVMCALAAGTLVLYAKLRKKWVQAQKEKTEAVKEE